MQNGSMENLLLKYMGKGLADETPGSDETKPLVTISREFGCPSKLIAQMLVDEINKNSEASHARKWKFINKEVLESAAKELQVSSSEVKYLINAGTRGLLEDVLVSFSSVYASNIKVKRTLVKVVSTIANAGYVVLVGRGSAAILRGRSHSLHIRLMAPEDWRIPEICKMRDISTEAAVKLMNNTDQKRAGLYETILGRKMDPYVFDVVFNCATTPKHRIVSDILAMMVNRALI
jgi:cytidylate kinase